MLSINRQTNEELVGTDSEDIPLFSRNEPLHRLLDVLSVSDEEDELLSSKLRTQRERMFPWFNINPIPCVHRNDLGA